MGAPWPGWNPSLDRWYREGARDQIGTRVSAALREAIRRLAEEGIESDAAFDLVGPALQDFGEENLAERLLLAVPDAPWLGVAHFLAIASWDVSPAAESTIFRTIEGWLLEATDARRVQIALNLDVIPFSRPGCEVAVLEEVLARVASRFPETRAKCSNLLQQRYRTAAGRS